MSVRFFSTGDLASERVRESELPLKNALQWAYPHTVASALQAGTAPFPHFYL